MADTPYAIVVEVDVVTERFDDCVALTHAAVDRNVAEDPGCQRMELCVKADGSPVMVLYEVYNSQAAFDAHLKTPGFVQWRAATREMVTGMRMTRLHVRRSSTA